MKVEATGYSETGALVFKRIPLRHEGEALTTLNEPYIKFKAITPTKALADTKELFVDVFVDGRLKYKKYFAVRVPKGDDIDVAYNVGKESLDVFTAKKRWFRKLRRNEMNKFVWLLLLLGCTQDPTYSPELDNVMTLQPIETPWHPMASITETHTPLVSEHEPWCSWPWGPCLCFIERPDSSSFHFNVPLPGQGPWGFGWTGGD